MGLSAGGTAGEDLATRRIRCSGWLGWVRWAMRTRRISAGLAAAIGAVVLVGCTVPVPTGSPRPAPGDLTTDELAHLVKGARPRTYSCESATKINLGGQSLALEESSSHDLSDAAVERSRTTVRIRGVSESLSTEFISIGDDTFVRGDGLVEQGASDAWARIDTALLASYFEPPPLPDAYTWILTYLDSAEVAEFVGKEAVDGAPVARYRVTLNAEAMAGLGMSDGGPGSHVELWVDGNGLVRKLSVETAFASMVATWSGFNQPVGVEAPKTWVEMPR